MLRSLSQFSASSQGVGRADALKRKFGLVRFSFLLSPSTTATAQSVLNCLNAVRALDFIINISAQTLSEDLKALVLRLRLGYTNQNKLGVTCIVLALCSLFCLECYILK